MGYRSDVAITIYGNSEKLKAVKQYADDELAKLSDEEQAAVLEQFEDSEEDTQRMVWNIDDEDEEDRAFFFFATHVKWYDGYVVVNYINSIFNYAEEIAEDGDEFYGEHVRVGEDMTDNQIDTFGAADYRRLDICRSIEY